MPDAAAPLTPGEYEDLIPGGLRTRADLNAWEKAAVLKGRRWALGRRRDPSRVLSEQFLRELHRKMFADTWRWAGVFRTSELPGMVPAGLIPVALMSALADANAWVSEQTIFAREIGARFHHRLVGIHPFAHGNGRWSRLATDALLLALREAPATWGTSSGSKLPRSEYGKALKLADDGEYEALLRFMWG